MRYLCTLSWSQGLGARFPAARPEAYGGLVLAVVGQDFLILTCGNAGNLDRVAGHVGGALLAFGHFHWLLNVNYSRYTAGWPMGEGEPGGGAR